MMQMLAAGGIELLCDSFRGPDPDNPNGYFEYEPAKRLLRDTSWFDEAVGKALKVVHALVSALPRDREVRVILMRRKLEEVVASQQAMLVRRGAPLDGVLENDRLIAIFREQLDEVSRWVAAQPNFSLLTVDYGALLDDPATAAKAVDEFLGCGLDRGAMTRAVDPKLYRQRGGAA